MKVRYASTVGNIASMCGGTLLCGDPGAPVKTISSDSRDLGEEALFVPLTGERFDGHDFINGLAKEKKIRAFLTMKREFCIAAEEHGLGAVLCDDTLLGLGRIALEHRKRFSAAVIAVTGTNGKTTTKELIYRILSTGMKGIKNEKNYNNEIGVPFTLLRLGSGDRMAVIEMGMNHSGELERLSRMTLPDMAVITNVGEGHLEFLGSTENVAMAKSEIMLGMKPGALLLINRDTDCFDIVMERARMASLRVRTFGLYDNADLHPDSVAMTRDSVEITIGGSVIKAPLYGVHNVYNLLAAVAVAREFNIEENTINSSLAEFKNVDGRSQIMDRGYIVINDTYNSNPLSARYALRSVKEIFPEKRKIAVLSDMKELGSHAASYHARTGGDVAKNDFTMLCLWGDMAEEYRSGAIKAGMGLDRIRIFQDKAALSRFLKASIAPGDVVLVKGSRSMKMEEVVQEIC